MGATNAKKIDLPAFGLRDIELSRVQARRPAVKSKPNITLSDLTNPRRSGQGGWAMTTALTRVPAQPLRLAGAFALTILVIIAILPH
jgi:hypothetical protein